MSQIFDALRDTPRTGRHNITDEFHSDVSWFLQYTKTTNGLVHLPDRRRSALHYLILLNRIPAEITDSYTNIAHLEAINLIVSMRVLDPPQPGHHKLVINTDNSASQHVLSSAAYSQPVPEKYGCTLLRTQVEILHKPDKDLILADALSRHTRSTAA